LSAGCALQDPQPLNALERITNGGQHCLVMTLDLLADGARRYPTLLLSQLEAEMAIGGREGS